MKINPDVATPVLEGLQESVIQVPETGRRIVTWLDVDRVQERVVELKGQLRDAGWDLLEERPILFGVFGSEIQFRRHGVKLAIVVSRAPGRRHRLSLVEWRPQSGNA